MSKEASSWELNELFSCSRSYSKVVIVVMSRLQHLDIEHGAGGEVKFLLLLRTAVLITIYKTQTSNPV